MPGGVPAWSWGGYLPGPGGVSAPGGGVCTCLVGGGYLPGPGGGVCSWGVYLPGLGGEPAWSWGVYLPGPRGVYLPGQGVYLPGPGRMYMRGPGRGPGQVPPPVNRMTDRCKNITLAKTSFRPVINKNDLILWRETSFGRSFYFAAWVTT